jgi:hypothetical protein
MSIRILHIIGFLASLVVSILEFGARGHWFKSRDAHKLSWVWTAFPKSVNVILMQNASGVNEKKI